MSKNWENLVKLQSCKELANVLMLDYSQPSGISKMGSFLEKLLKITKTMNATNTVASEILRMNVLSQKTPE